MKIEVKIEKFRRDYMKRIVLYGAALTLAVSLMGCSVNENKNVALGESQSQIEEHKTGGFPFAG